MKNAFFAFFGLALVLASCHVTEEVVEVVEIACNEISYETSIKSILDANCIKCHSGGMPKYGIDLASYETASTVIDHRIICVINWGDNCNKMPPEGGQLSSGDIRKIQCWVENGFRK
ncbi:MAG: hypothetical protein ACI837_000800 [Crocinitomicaceae bacterium]|jgi:hypothetical protein